jgi:hypothetical protein
MSLIVEDDNPVNPTDISLFRNVAKMIFENYFPDMSMLNFSTICHIILTYCIIGCKFTVMPILAVEWVIQQIFYFMVKISLLIVK